jgi:hypothetical protein
MRTTLVALISPASVACGGEVGSVGDANADATLDVTHMRPDAGLDADTFVDATLDALIDGDNSCASCPITLDALCSPDGGADCPPPLDSPNLYAWAQTLIGPAKLVAPICLSFDQCPEMVALYFKYPSACENLPPGGEAFLFDVTTKNLIAIVDTCDEFSIAHCQSASECIPNRCVPNENGFVTNSPACPVLPDAGLDGG